MNFVAIAVGFGVGAVFGGTLMYLSTRTHVEVKLGAFRVKASSVREAVEITKEICAFGKELTNQMARGKKAESI